MKIFLSLATLSVCGLVSMFAVAAMQNSFNEWHKSIEPIDNNK